MTQPPEPIARLLRDAAQARQRGVTGDELSMLDRAVALHPYDPQANNARGMRALADRDFATAVEHFTRAADADPGEPALRINLATAFRALGDAQGERRSLQQALDIDQLQFVAQLRMAELLERQGQMSLAAKHWGAVVQLGAGVADAPPAVREAVTRGQRFLAEHNAIFAASLQRELGDVPRDGSMRRFNACVDHMLGRRRVFRNECAGIYYPFLPADEFFERAHFPWFERLEARTAAIRAEALALLAGGGEAIRPYVRLEPGTPQNKWSPLDQSLEWSACFLWEYGEPNAAVCARCPETVAALAEAPQNRVPGKAPSAFFSILRPGGRIPPHTGVTNTRAIVHLPLVVPHGCGFRVGGETRAWREGEAFAFDDTIEHEAWNTSDQQRIVLIFDVWNPHLSAVEQDNLVKVFAVADRGIVSAKA
ncbi:aspartyl/asparaginyl beta-hydroxylase domain-containing protein [Sphingomonas sp.]|jgi:aspartyl/asparaginyl beta-hydroxylase (cupin superfamily)|uniref:aspartyl/asparaginyl beta-hydroxylase domain-containing protein n=1 Tax=Sphingomonas sp. TaxID=28214 RepID=UPI002D7E9693|nr:aspartyl/asparaginyl beta-hydroxylase domain-containing protein [Sphingomonas sp.]HEU0043069.1 aspartyl/asparaginyl beta-hydroxylase domain-containing protein [Sphingomonas sp.]